MSMRTIFSLANPQTRALGASAANATVLSGRQDGVRLCPKGGGAYVSWTGTATSSSTYIPQDAVEYIAVTGRVVISALQADTGGTLHIDEIFPS